MNKTVICYSTKDRTEFTSQTLPRVMAEAEGNFDLHWLDGSISEEGRRFPFEFASKWRAEHDGKYPLTKLHQGVGGGAAAVIQAAFTFFLGMPDEVEYVGLLENDVLLEPGWFEKAMALFGKEENVGAVSARCFTHRILEKKDGYAVMADVGAGMFMVRKRLILSLLENWRTPALWECQALCKYFTGIDYPIPKGVLEQDPKIEKTWCMTHDWYWPIILMKQGYKTLAFIPSMAKNLDDPDETRDPVER